MFELHKAEVAFLKKLNTPNRIQDYLDSIAFNFEEEGETCMSPRRVLQAKKAHCIEGAMLAATALLLSGRKPLILNLKVDEKDNDHIVALYSENGYWGAISKTNHAVLRFRDPVYRSIRELAMSFFHEYFLASNGKKTMKGFSKAINLRRYGTKWVTAEEDLWIIAEDIYDGRHVSAVSEKNKKYLRKASSLERESASLPEWK
jgi:hypothetical protein